MKRCKKLLAYLLSLALLMTNIPVLPAVAEGVSGTCGESVTWELVGDTLFISGTGTMEDYDYENMPPWYDYFESIRVVVVADGVTSIGARAFQEHFNLESVQLGSSVMTIGEAAFNFCNSLLSINLPEGLVSIGAEAFGWCDMLQSLTFPQSLESLGYASVHHCGMLESITIPENLTDIGADSFAYCAGLSGIWVDSRNPKYSNDSRGVLFDKGKTTLILAPGGVSGCYTVPQGIFTIREHAFEGCHNLESVEISEGVTEIGTMVFYGCMALQSVTIPVTVTDIRSNAFSGGVLTDVYYGGSQSKWDRIHIEDGNEMLFFASIHFAEVGVEISYIVVSPPAKTEYWLGNVLDTTGMVITAYYSDGHSEIVTEGYTVSGYDAYYVTKQTITVSYKGCTDTFTVTVKDHEVTHITVTPPTVTECWVGGILDLTGMVVKAYYDNGITRTIISGYDVTGFHNSIPGEQTITVTFKGCSATFTFTVKEIVVTHITVTAPVKTQYQEGEELDIDGMQVIAFFSDGSGLVIHEGYTLTGYDANTPGEQTVTVTYEGASAAFTVNVEEAVLTGIAVTPPSQTQYFVGDDLMLEDMVVTAAYSNGSTKVVEDYEIGPWNPYVEGSQEISVTYEGFVAYFTVTFRLGAVTGIEIVETGRTEYYENEELDTSGLVVRVFYESGIAYTGIEGFTVSGYDPAIVGEQTIIVAYQGFDASFTVNVIAILYGDVDGDGAVTNRDRAVLARYLADWEDYQDIDLRAADVNRDGEVNTLDRVILTRYLADWEEYNQLPYTG